MKRVNVIVIFSFLIIGLLTSGMIRIKPGSLIPGNSSGAIEQDITAIFSLIRVDSFSLAIFPPSSGIQYYRDGIVFLSLSKNEKKMSSTHISFGTTEAYYAVADDSITGKKMIFSQAYPFLHPCESITFNRDFNTMYFTKSSDKNKKEKIYMAKFTSKGNKQTGWLAEEAPLDFCTDNSVYSHPTLSSDERMLIFASDKTGFFGGMDLFITRKEEDEWSAPENLGSIINTTGNEFFPFLDTDNNLFFSSDGHPGYGGYDIFTCKFNGETWDKPTNLSRSVNTEKDDIAFTINKTDGKSAFYSSGQKSVINGLQLFRMTVNENAEDSNLLTLSHIFNGKPGLRPVLQPDKTIAEIKPVEAEPGKDESKTKTVEKDIVTLPPEKFKIPEEKKEVIAVAPQISEPPIFEKPLKPVPVKDIVVYKVQFLSSMTPKGEYQISLFNKSYDVGEYFYKGAYRQTIGEFSTLEPAKELQSACRKAGYPEAFVAAFKNNTRSLAQELFK